MTLGVEIEGDLVGQRARWMWKGIPAPASGDRPVQVAHEHVIGLWRAGDHVPFSLAVGEIAEKTRRAYFAG